MNQYETHIMKNPRLPFILHKMELTPLKYAGGGNWHENVEFLFFTEGSGAVRYDDRDIPVTVGDTVAVSANCLHAFRSGENGLSYYCMIVDRTFCRENDFDTNGLLFEPCFRDEVVDRMLEDFLIEYRKPEDIPFRNPAIRAAVLRLTAYLCRNHSRPDTEENDSVRSLYRIKQAIGFIRAYIGGDIPLDDVAARVGMSRYYFAHEFRRITGYSFVTYVNLTRCEKAKGLLAENLLEIGEVGEACGFSNRSYFTRTFRDYAGMLPSEYRRRNSEKNGKNREEKKD